MLLLRLLYESYDFAYYTKIVNCAYYGAYYKAYCSSGENYVHNSRRNDRHLILIG